MPEQIPDVNADAPIIVVGIGNTSVSVARCVDDHVHSVVTVPTGDEAGARQALEAHWAEIENPRSCATVIASVVPDALERIREVASDISGREPLVIGEKLDLPLAIGVRTPETLGVDRVCQAAAAYETIQEACCVVSFGTAVTVDFVNEEGVFVGGAIFPGVQMQLRSLNEYTAALPHVPAQDPGVAFGGDTIEAIQLGVVRGIAGAVRSLVEGYATEVSRWPQVVATGGDVALMQAPCDFIDTFVEHLGLRGIGLAYRKMLAKHGL